MNSARSHSSRKVPLIAGLSAAAILLAGCSGGGSGIPAPAGPQSPKVSAPAAVDFNQDTTSGAQLLRLEDADTAVAQLELSVASSDETLLPLRGIMVEGAGAERMLRITPAAESTGSATLTLTARDPGGLIGSTTIAVRVNPVLVAFSNLTRSTFATQDGGDAGRVSGVTVQGDVDDDPAAFDALLQSGAQ